MTASFNPTEFLSQAQAACELSSKGYGLIYETWQRDVNGLAEDFIALQPEVHRAEAAAILKANGILVEDDGDDDADSDYCMHHFPPNCCPIGCDDREF